MKTIVMTGGTSGLGKVAAQQLLRTPNTRLLIGAHREGPAKAVSGRLCATKIDALVLNAGLQFPNTYQRTEDGFERTFAVMRSSIRAMRMCGFCRIYDIRTDICQIV